MGAPPVYGNPFMQGLTGGLTQSVNKILDEQAQKETQNTLLNKGILNALMQSGTPEIQALALSALQNPKALKHLGGLAEDPSYQQILQIMNRAKSAGGQGAAPAGPQPPPNGNPLGGQPVSPMGLPNVGPQPGGAGQTPMGALLTGGPPSGGDSASAGSPLATAGQAPQSAALPDTSAIGSSPGAPQGLARAQCPCRVLPLLQRRLLRTWDQRGQRLLLLGLRVAIRIASPITPGTCTT